MRLKLTFCIKLTAFVKLWSVIRPMDIGLVGESIAEIINTAFRKQKILYTCRDQIVF